MRHFLPLLLLAALTACDDSIHPPLADKPATGTLWGPCDLTNVEDPDWWGCTTTGVFDLACARPVSDLDLSICVPEIWDPAVDEDCGNIEDPGHGLGVRPHVEAYCVLDCLVDDDCAPGMACSPQSHLCAWVGGA